MKPLIALTPGIHADSGELRLRPACLEAIRHVDAIPLVLPASLTDNDLRELVTVFDGFLFTGGPDIHPFRFGEDTHTGCGAVSPQRDALELSLLHIAMEAGKPLLGICRGIQIFNIGLGGTIYQDISEESRSDERRPLAHSQPFAHELYAHHITITPGTLLADLAQSDRIAVNSTHHQAVRKPGSRLTVTGRSPDGLAEAVELPGYPSFFLGVQWHPEYLWRHDRTAVRIFKAFADAARQSQARSHQTVTNVSSS